MDKHPKWSLDTLQRRGCADLSSKGKIKEWKNQIANGGTKREKLQAINGYVFEQFKSSRDESRIIKTVNLQQWGIQKATEIKALDVFKASSSWASQFKLRNRISSRKVTHLVNRHEVINMDKILEKVESFRVQVKERMKMYPAYAILNTDQCGFAYELVSNRTLTHKGEKKVFGYAQSPKNLVTHSYTVQYVISAEGKIVGNVFVCLQEISGKLGPRVEQGLWKSSAPNVTITCSRSGKLSTSLFEYFLQNVVAECMDEDFLFIVDSWSGQVNPDIYRSVFGPSNQRPECELHIIPEKCTPYCQPLDTTFHRQLKNLARRILNYCQVFVEPDGIHPDDRITTRIGVIKFQSLLHHQLSAPIFNPMIRYAFYSSGLVEEKEKFLNVEQVCFTFAAAESTKCSRQNCEKMRFIKCSRCRDNLCFSCFYFEFHTIECPK